MSFGSLDLLNTKDIETLANLNKTTEDLFRESTYKLNVDFYFQSEIDCLAAITTQSLENKNLQHIGIVLVGSIIYFQ